MAIKTYSALVDAINKNMSIALANVSKQMVEQLRFYLKTDFYDLYSPSNYERTDTLKNSPTYEMLTKNMAKVFIDTENMHYKNISGIQNVNLAALGFHGTENIFREGYFWEDFVAWCNINVPNLLKKELKNVGINVR